MMRGVLCLLCCVEEGEEGCDAQGAQRGGDAVEFVAV